MPVFLEKSTSVSSAEEMSHDHCILYRLLLIGPNCDIGEMDTVSLTILFFFRLKDLGQIKEGKRITTPTATEISLQIAVLPCVGPFLQGKIQTAQCPITDLGSTHPSVLAQASGSSDLAGGNDRQPGQHSALCCGGVALTM